MLCHICVILYQSQYCYDDPCRVLKELLAGIRDQIGCLYRLTESVAMLDMLHCFAHSCTVSNYGGSMPLYTVSSYSGCCTVSNCGGSWQWTLLCPKIFLHLLLCDAVLKYLINAMKNDWLACKCITNGNSATNGNSGQGSCALFNFFNF